MKTPILLIPIAVALGMVGACRPDGHVDASYLTADAASRWKDRLQAAGTPLHPYLNTVVLVSPPSECGACISEMTEWARTEAAANWHLVWLAPGNDLRDALVWRNRQGWDLEPVSWTGLGPVESDWVPFLPAKILLAPDGSILRIHRLGGDPDFTRFVEDARMQRVAGGG